MQKSMKLKLKYSKYTTMERTEIHAICLQETWLSENSDTSLLHIDGFNLIMQGKICSAHADVRT